MEWSGLSPYSARQGAQERAQGWLGIVVIVGEDKEIRRVRSEHSLREQAAFLLGVVGRHRVVSQLNDLPAQCLHSLPKDLGEARLILHSPSEGGGVSEHSHADCRWGVGHTLRRTAVPPWRDGDRCALEVARLARDEFKAQDGIIAIRDNGGDGIGLEPGSEPFGVHLILEEDPDRTFGGEEKTEQRHHNRQGDKQGFAGARDHAGAGIHVSLAARGLGSRPNSSWGDYVHEAPRQVQASSPDSVLMSSTRSGSLLRFMTLTEKILARAAGKARVQAGDNVWVQADILMTHDVCGPGTIGVFKREFGPDRQSLGPQQGGHHPRPLHLHRRLQVEPQRGYPARVRQGAGHHAISTT